MYNSKRANKKVIKAITLGMSAMMAVQPVMSVPVMADECEVSDNAVVQESVMVQDAVQESVGVQNIEPEIIVTPDIVYEEEMPAAGETEAGESMTDTSASGEGAVSENPPVIIDGNAEKTDDADETKGAAGKVAGAVGGAVDEIQSLDKLDESINAATDTIKDSTEDIKAAAGTINTAGSASAVNAAYEEAQAANEAAHKAYEDAKAEYDEMAAEIENKKAEIAALEEAYNTLLTDLNTNESALDGYLTDLKAKRAALNELVTTVKAAQDRLGEDALNKLANLAANIEGTSGKELKDDDWLMADEIFADVLKYYYLPSQGIDAKYVASIDWVKFGEESHKNYAVVTIKKDEEEQKLYFNYICDGNNGSLMVIFEKNVARAEGTEEASEAVAENSVVLNNTEDSDESAQLSNNDVNNDEPSKLMMAKSAMVLSVTRNLMANSLSVNTYNVRNQEDGTEQLTESATYEIMLATAEDTADNMTTDNNPVENIPYNNDNYTDFIKGKTPDGYVCDMRTGEDGRTASDIRQAVEKDVNGYTELIGSGKYESIAAAKTELKGIDKLIFETGKLIEEVERLKKEAGVDSNKSFADAVKEMLNKLDTKFKTAGDKLKLAKDNMNQADEAFNETGKARDNALARLNTSAAGNGAGSATGGGTKGNADNTDGAGGPVKNPAKGTVTSIGAALSEMAAQAEALKSDEEAVTEAGGGVLGAKTPGGASRETTGSKGRKGADNAHKSSAGGTGNAADKSGVNSTDNSGAGDTSENTIVSLNADAAQMITTDRTEDAAYANDLMKGAVTIIEDEAVAKAAVGEETAKLGWWFVLIAAALGITTEEAYRRYRKKQ